MTMYYTAQRGNRWYVFNEFGRQVSGPFDNMREADNRMEEIYEENSPKEHWA